MHDCIQKIKKVLRHVVSLMLPEPENSWKRLQNYKHSLPCIDIRYSCVCWCPEDVPAAMQVYHSYGDKRNEALLQYYGFVEEDNVHDYYTADLLQFVKEHGNATWRRIEAFESGPYVESLTQVTIAEPASPHCRLLTIMDVPAAVCFSCILKSMLLRSVCARHQHWDLARLHTATRMA